MRKDEEEEKINRLMSQLGVLLIQYWSRGFRVHLEDLDRTITSISLLFCGFATIITTTLYMHESQYQPIFYPADALYLFAISGSVHYLRIDSTKHTYFVISFLLSVVTVIFTIGFSDWDNAQDVYQGETIPFAYVTQITAAPDVYGSIYTLRYAALMVAAVCSTLNVIFEIANIPNVVDDLFPEITWCLGFVLMLGLVPRAIFTVLNYPRQEKADSVHFVLISGMILSLQPSILTVVWIGIGVIFSTLYLSTINRNDCFLDMSCYQSHFANETYVQRTSSVTSTPHIFAEISYGSLVLNIILVVLGYIITLVTLIQVGVSIRDRWTSYTRISTELLSQSGVRQLASNQHLS